MGIIAEDMAASVIVLVRAGAIVRQLRAVFIIL
jgi:hypothetical protein